jgi:hypothetical protein
MGRPEQPTDPVRIRLDRLCLRLQRGAACGAGGMMAWERGTGKGREGAEAVDVDYALLYGEDPSTAVVRVRKFGYPSPERIHDIRILHPEYRLPDR